MRKSTIALTLGLALATPFGLGCEREGPAERAGERLDDATRGVRDKLSPSGPAERAGEKMDDAVDDATD
jgi:hypothetical protein